MKGTLVNAGGILLGSLIGLMIKKNIPKRYQDTLIHGLSLAVGIIGLQMALKTQNLLILILSIAIGGIIGEWINIQKWLDKLGHMITKSIGEKHGNAGQGFVTASLVFCVGAMAIVGSIQDGLTGDSSTLYAKAILDSMFSVIFSSGMGIGVALSSISVLVYQGSITLLASGLNELLSEATIREMTAVGGLLIVSLSIHMLEIKFIKVANLLPAVFVAVILMRFV
ncbi:MAG: hypothetical protein H6Q67_1567 [Firmicutes bacterium]|nr:hypothetical protein [Bacillota bacterium]